MQKNKSFKISIYTLLFNPLRLTMMTLFVVSFLLQIACYKSENMRFSPPKTAQISNSDAIDINSASAEELKKLPKIG